MQNLEIINVYIFFSLEDLQPSGASVLLWRFKVKPVWKPVLLRPRWRQVYHVEVLADSYTKMAPLSSRASGTNDDIDHTFWPLLGAINVCKSRIIIEKKPQMAPLLYSLIDQGLQNFGKVLGIQIFWHSRQFLSPTKRYVLNVATAHVQFHIYSKL